MTLLVTGATGQFGSIVIDTLLKTVPAEKLAVSVRTPEKAAHLQAKGVDVRHGDFDQPETLDHAFAGVDRLLIVSADGDNATRIRQHQAAVDAAKKAGVGFIAYTSVAKADASTLSLAEVHRATEEAIRATGIPYSFLRNNWYAENEAGSVQGAIHGAPWLNAAGSARAGWALRSDYAEAAAVVLAGEGHDNTIYELSGKPLTQAELAAITGEVLGKAINVIEVDDAAFGQALRDAGLPDFVVAMFVDMQGPIRAGSLDVESADLETLLGRPATPLNVFVSALAAR